MRDEKHGSYKQRIQLLEREEIVKANKGRGILLVYDLKKTLI